MARLGRGRRSGAHIARAPSLTTPTPLVRRRLVQTPVSNDRAMFIARFFRQKRAHIVVKPPVQFVAPPASMRHPAIVSPHRRARVKSFFGRKRRINIAHGLFPAVVQPPKRPLVSRAVSRRPMRVRAMRKRPVVVRARSATATRTLVPVFVTSNARRRTRTRSYYARHRVHIQYGPLATTTLPAVIVTGVFDAAEPASAFDRSEPIGGFDPTTVGAGFDRSQP